MSKFERVICLFAYTFFAFVIITTMEDLGKIIGFEQMEDLGVAFLFGAVYMHLLVMDKKKKEKEEE